LVNKICEAHRNGNRIVDRATLDGFLKSFESSLPGAKRRACALKRFGAQAWQSRS